jgi:WD40 repeat protein
MKDIGVNLFSYCIIFFIDRVTAIYTIPNKDILITISESNIKVWDLEYDECIKNMNEHNSSIVYISQTPADEE